MSSSPIAHASAGRALAELDAHIARGPRLTLAPDREHPTSLCALVRDLAPGPLGGPLTEALLRVGTAQIRAFPGNLFWDMDALAASLLRQARRSDDPPARLAELAGRIAHLQTIFGGETAIHFRYVHDFVYGYDWAKWVKRDPDARASVGPFEEPFLIYSEQRGGELLELIAHDDAKYHQLAEGQARNPFGFSREPGDEVRLFRDLAARDLLPVRAWERDPQPRWEPPYLELREERAQQLGL